MRGGECECLPGWTGIYCNVDVNECREASNGNGPCEHGRCQNFNGGYQCACDPGWTGKNCDVNSDDCASNPCRAGSRSVHI